jgi:hypothetical protein
MSSIGIVAACSASLMVWLDRDGTRSDRRFALMRWPIEDIGALLLAPLAPCGLPSAGFFVPLESAAALSFGPAPDIPEHY